MARAETGIDVVTRLRDETRQGVASVERSIAGMGQRLESTAGMVGKRFTDGLMGAMISGIAAAGIDRALETVLQGFKSEQTGREIGETIARGIGEALRNIPVAGALGELGARGLGWLFGDGTSTFEERQQGLDAQRRRAASAQEGEGRITDRLRDDTLTPAARRRRQFDEEAGEVLRNVDPSQVGATRDRLRRQFDEREAREFLRAQDVERRAVYEQRNRDEQQRAANEQRRLAEQARMAEQDRRKKLDEAEALFGAEGRLAGAQESRFSSGRAEAFTSQRQQITKLTDQSAKQTGILEQMLALAKEQAAQPLETADF